MECIKNNDRSLERAIREIQDATQLILTTDLNGTICTFNATAERWLGYTAEDLVGNASILMFYDPLKISERAEELSQELGIPIAASFEAIAAKASRGSIETREWMYIRKDGSPLALQLSVSALRDQDDQITGFVALGNNISDRKQVESAFLQLAAIVESSDDAIIGMNLEGKITSWNIGAEKLYGYTAEEAKGQSVVSLLIPPVAPQAISEILETGQLEEYLDPRENQHQKRDGTLIDVALTVSSVRDITGKIIGSSMIARDISDRRAVERMKDEFTSIVSHELRTPLTSIRGSLGLLLTGKLGTLSDKGQRMLEIAINNTDRLVRLINDILDLERLESSKATLNKQTCYVADLMQQAVEVMQSMADKAEVMLLASPTAAQLYADPDRLLQVFTNLISNAIKFSSPGGVIELSASWSAPVGQAAGTHSSTLQIAVRDEGRGIPPEKIETIFGRFQQVDASDSRQKGGTGLGLAICRSIIQQHDGQIWVESTPGQGSTFYMTLPAIPVQQPIIDSSGAIASPDSDQRWILICHHSPNSDPVLETLLQKQGYRVSTVIASEEAIAKAAACCPTVILIDLNMPDRKGWEIMAALKEQAATQDIPLIVFSTVSPQLHTNSPDLVGWVHQAIDYVSLCEAVKRISGQQGRTGRVLIVEDDLDLAGVLIAAFNHHSVQTAHARTEQEAIELCQQFVPDLLVLDLILAQGDGFAVVNWLRQQDRLSQIPLVVYSARDLDLTEQSRLQLGQTEFMTKGRISPEALEGQVISLLNQVIVKNH